MSKIKDDTMSFYSPSHPLYRISRYKKAAGGSTRWKAENHRLVRDPAALSIADYVDIVHPQLLQSLRPAVLLVYLPVIVLLLLVRLP
jgi:hypothetical protein